jgi:hypothetical protein
VLFNTRSTGAKVHDVANIDCTVFITETDLSIRNSFVVELPIDSDVYNVRSLSLLGKTFNRVRGYISLAYLFTESSLYNSGTTYRGQLIFNKYQKKILAIN